MTLMNVPQKKQAHFSVHCFKKHN